MGFIAWIVLGALAGWIAKAIMKEEGGLLKNIIVGILGALLGGFIVQLLGGEGVNNFSVYSLIVSIIGAVVLISLVRLVTGRKA